MAKKIAIGRFGNKEFPECNTKGYQRNLAAKLRKFADILDDPLTEVGRKRDFAGDDPNVTWFVFMASGVDQIHFTVWGALNRPARDDDFGPEDTPPGGDDDPPPPVFEG